MRVRVVVTLTTAGLERERPNLERGSVVGAGVVGLERLYGKTVWEALLRNTHLTVPEVARLARLGTMPRSLLELIVGNPAWLQVPQVRRALLANPRLTHELVSKVLLALPRDELQLVPQITAHPAAVRQAAKAMVRR